MVSKEFQLFLLLSPQGVDDGDGQSQRLPRVTMRSQCIHPGAGRGDVFCQANPKKHEQPSTFGNALNALKTACSLVPHKASIHAFLCITAVHTHKEASQSKRLFLLTVPQGPAARVKERIFSVVMVTVVGVEVVVDNVLQVAVLPVEIACLDGSRENRPVGPGARICERRRGDGAEERKLLCHSQC